MFAFKLGNNKELSLLELKTLIGVDPISVIKDLAFFELIHEKAVKIMDRVGGSSKLIEFIHEDLKFSKDDFIGFASEWLDDNIEGKVSFGLTYIGDLGWPKAFNVGLELKKAVKAKGRSCRVVTSKNDELSSADIIKNKILGKNGAEFVVIRDGKYIRVGITKVVQSIDAWSYRDMKRPGRDAKRGMLPPKLARIMINLAEVNRDTILLDAFCGSGTVLMEAGEIGVKEMVASDISDKAVEDTKRTLEWLKESNDKDFSVKYFVSKAENLNAYLEDESIDAIVSELFLGEPKTGGESLVQIREEIVELTKLYSRSIKMLSRFLKSGGSMVLALPVSYKDGEELEIDLDEVRGELNLVDKVRYHRDNQFVGRDIVVLRKV